MFHSTFARAALPVMLFAAAVTAAAAADLAVTIEDVGGAGGTVRAGLFASPASFPGKPYQGQSVQAAPGRVVLVFRDLPQGRYAISAFHDLNDNQKLDTGLFGRPTEPVGFSRDARGRMGPPSFEDTAFSVDGTGAKIAVRLHQ